MWNFETRGTPPARKDPRPDAHDRPALEDQHLSGYECGCDLVSRTPEQTPKRRPRDTHTLGRAGVLQALAIGQMQRFQLIQAQRDGFQRAARYTRRFEGMGDRPGADASVLAGACHGIMSVCSYLGRAKGAG